MILSNLTKYVLSFIIAASLSVVAVPQTIGPQPQMESMWRIEIVENVGGIGWFTSLAVDVDDNLAISYFNTSSENLMYANWNGSAWSAETVDSAGDLRYYTSMAFDSNGSPHIGYYDASNGNLKYANWNGSTWSTETVDSVGVVGLYASIALDSSDNPHIGYYDYTKNDLKYAMWNGSAWSTETVDFNGDVGRYTSIAIDNNDNPHISYSDSTNEDLKYAKWDGSTWSNVTVDFSDWVGQYTSIAIDSSDNPHISYFDASNDNLKYAKWDGSIWSNETVDNEGQVGHDTSIAIDSSDNPHISYFDASNGNTKYATKADLIPPLEPVLSYSPTHLYFGDLIPGIIAKKTFEIWNSGNGTLEYSFSGWATWVASVDPTNGTGTGEHDTITVTIDTTGLLTHQNYTCTIDIMANGGKGVVHPYVTVVPPLYSLSLDIDPDTLNLKSKGRWITAYLTTEGANAEDIEASSLLLNDVVAPAWWNIQNETTLMVKFDRAAVQAILPVSNAVDIKITGQWRDGEAFELHDVIRVIDVGGHRDSPWLIHSREGPLSNLRMELGASSAYMEIERLQTTRSETDVSAIPVAPDGGERLSHYSSEVRSLESCLYRASSIIVPLI